MKKTMCWLATVLLLAGCEGKSDTQLVIDAGKQLQYTIDSNPARNKCETIAKGRERLTSGVIKSLQAQGCDAVLRSGTETNFTDATVFRHSMVMVCGAIIGRGFTGKTLHRQFIYSPEEDELVLEPTSQDDKTRFEGKKTLQQLQDDFQRQHDLYCK